jgi:hypothetical protein
LVIPICRAVKAAGRAAGLWFGGHFIRPVRHRRELGSVLRNYGGIMPAKTKSRSRDRQRVSAQKHEVTYAGKKLGKNGAARVRKAKAKLGRKTSRPKVMKEAGKLLRVRSKTNRGGGAASKRAAIAQMPSEQILSG